MTKPAKIVVPTIPTKDDSFAFTDKAEAFLKFFDKFVKYISSITDYSEEQAEAGSGCSNCGVYYKF